MVRLTKHHLAIFALVIANIIWGAASPIFKWSLQDIEPFTLAFLRFFIAALIILPFTLHHLHIQKRDWVKLTLLSLSGITINISFFFIGLQITSSINAPIIASAGPVFIILGSILFLGEHPKKKILLGTGVSLLGVLFIILQPMIEKGLDGSIIGNVFFTLATLGSVGHTLLLKELAPRYHTVTLTFWSFVLGSIPFLPMVFAESQDHGFLTDLSSQGFIGIIFGAVLSSALAYVLFNFALKYMVASEVGVFVYMDPIVAILIAIPLLGERITPIFFFGSLLVFVGIFIAERRIPWHPLHKLSKT